MNKPLRIGLIMQGGRGWIGGTEYIKNIIFALGSLPNDVRSTFEVCLLCSQSLEPSLYSEISPYLKTIYYQEVDLEPATFLNRLGWKLSETVLQQPNSRLEKFIKKEKIDFVYPCFKENKNRRFYRAAAWIADFQYQYFPELYSEQDLKNIKQGLADVARQVSTIVLSSKTAEADFKTFFPEAAHKSKVLSFRTLARSAWHEANPYEVQQNYNLPDRFFLVSNQFWKHKNHLVVFKALEILQKQSIYPIIVCTDHIYDHRQPKYADVILQTIHQFGLAQQVYLLGLIPRIEQIQLMRRSLAVIQPSLFEGWSTVVEDARALGKPMLLSDFSVHLEQRPPNSLFFERESPESLAPLLADWWEQRSPGPDLEQEAITKTNNLREVQAFGERFLEIAKGDS